jgi:AcrR family transcriptional regulator
MMEPGSVVSTDGRVARSQRTRLAIVDAMLEVIEEGEVQPTVEGIAARAGVAQRTVFQHYADREALFAAAGDRQLERLEPLLEPMPASGPFTVRLDAFVARRAELYELMTPVRRATRQQAPFSEVCEGTMRALQARKRADVLRVFASELDRCPPAERRELEAAVCVAACWSTWEALRTEQQLGVEAAAAAMRCTLRALLSQH